MLAPDTAKHRGVSLWQPVNSIIDWPFFGEPQGGDRPFRVGSRRPHVAEIWTGQLRTFASRWRKTV